MLGMLISQFGTKRANPLQELSSKIKLIAIQTLLVMRISKKFKPEVFLLALMRCANSGKASFNQIAITMANIDAQCDLSAQALWERITSRETALEQFLARSFALICSRPIMNSEMRNSPFSRILTEDSSFVRMLKACAELFPAHGNGHGKTAGVKLDLVFDLLTGEALNVSIHKGTEQDRTIGKDLLSMVKKSDLVLRDMGYFDVSVFHKIEQIGADWLSRLPASVKARSKDGSSLESILSNTKGRLVDRQVTLTKQGKAARIIAVRKSQEKADQAVAELRKQAGKEGYTPSKTSLERARWHVLVTSVSKEVMTATELGKLYAQRWQVEIVFKAWKQSSYLGKALSKRSSYQHLLGIFLAETLKLVVSMCCYSRLRQSGGADVERLSISKINDWLSARIQSCHSLLHLLEESPRLRHVIGDKRKRKSQLLTLLELLS